MRILVLIFVCFFCASPALARSDYPSKPVKILTMGTPGSVLDNTARRLASMFSREWSVPVDVANHPGGSGNVVANMVLSSRADGYTLGLTIATPFGDNFFVMEPRYTHDELAPISLISLSPIGIVSRADAPWNTIREAFQYAEAQGRPLRAADMGGRSREAVALVCRQEGGMLRSIPQQGGTSTLAAVLDGSVDVGIVGSIMVDHIRAGKVKPLAVLGAQRTERLPGVPTLLEQGYGYVSESPLVLFASARVPEDIVLMIAATLERISRTEEFRERILDELSADPMPVGQAVAMEYLREYYNRFARENGVPELP